MLINCISRTHRAHKITRKHFRNNVILSPQFAPTFWRGMCHSGPIGVFFKPPFYRDGGVDLHPPHIRGTPPSRKNARLDVQLFLCVRQEDFRLSKTNEMVDPWCGQRFNFFYLKIFIYNFMKMRLIYYTNVIKLMEKKLIKWATNYF